MAAYRKLVIYQGDDYVHEMVVQEDGEPVDVSERTYASQIKKKADGEVVEEFTVDASDASDGIIRFTLTNEETTLMTPGTYLFDVEQRYQGRKLTFMTGPVVVGREITKES